MRQLHQLEMPPFKPTERMSHIKVIPQRLYNDIFGRQNLFGGALGSKTCREALGVWEVALGFVGNEHSGARDNLPLVRHGRIEEVEAAEKLNTCCLFELVSARRPHVFLKKEAHRHLSRGFAEIS